ncbi:MAG: GNAT family N-acetyltransferase [Proteobacteria bacterium]|nr:GNAT family N-acetyltransferase [Pseudomonadota bacterium]
MKVRTLEQTDLEPASALLFQVFDRVAKKHNYQPPWPGESDVSGLLGRYRRDEPACVVVAEEGGAVIGVGAARVRGEVASIGPIAAYVDGRGIGGAIVDELLLRVENAGAVASRLYVDAWNPSAYALYAGRGFAVFDVVMHIERAPGPAPSLDSARGLEVRPFETRDLEQLRRFDQRLTGHDRGPDLADTVRLVARRRGDIVGYLGAQHSAGSTKLGPAVAVDASDLATLMAGTLTAEQSGQSARAAGLSRDEPQVARLSTAAPVVSMAALGLGFRVRELGVVMSRGAPPPARPPQLYSIDPEVL